jgi:hypothetical protein
VEYVPSTILPGALVGSPPLELFAELSIGLLGFTGVVSALGKSRLTTELRAFRVSALLRFGSTSLVASILPIVLGSYGLMEQTVWFVSSLVLVSAIAGISVWGFISNSRLLTSTMQLRVLASLVFTIVLGISAYLIYGLIYLPENMASIYLVSLTTMLGLGVYHFCMLVASIQYEEGT